jgi:hypothetical protein
VNPGRAGIGAHVAYSIFDNLILSHDISVFLPEEMFEITFLCAYFYYIRFTEFVKIKLSSRYDIITWNNIYRGKESERDRYSPQGRGNSQREAGQQYRAAGRA